MNTYRCTIQTDFYPITIDVKTNKFETAIFRAIKQWRVGKGKGTRPTEMRISAIKLITPHVPS